MADWDIPRLDDIKTWATETLATRGQNVYQIDDIRLMPWSAVFRCQTSSTPVYLKWMAPLFRREAAAIRFLSDLNVSRHLPVILGENVELSAFLLQDGGNVLRTQMGADYDVPLNQRVLHFYADLQRQTLKASPTLPTEIFHDYRLTRLPDLFDDLLQQRDFLMHHAVPGALIDHLVEQKGVFLHHCQQLGSLGIPDTIEHNDFHDNNVLIKGDHITLNDWNDAAWSHPFFSAATFLNSAIKRDILVDGSKSYQELCTAYLTTWTDYAPISKLQDGLERARIVRLAVFAITLGLVYRTPGVETLPDLRDYWAQTLQTLSFQLEKDIDPTSTPQLPPLTI